MNVDGIGVKRKESKLGGASRQQSFDAPTIDLYTTNPRPDPNLPTTAQPAAIDFAHPASAINFVVPILTCVCVHVHYTVYERGGVMQAVECVVPQSSRASTVKPMPPCAPRVFRSYTTLVDLE